ncbi:MAG: DNA mismatch repair endonuclease MutL, partial [Halobacteriota archaeon]
PIDPSAAEAWAVDGLGHSDRDPDVEGDTKYGDGAFESDRGSERAMGLDAAFGTGTESVDGPDSERVSGSSIESTESTASIDSATEPTSEPSIGRTTNPTEQTESTESDEPPTEVTESDEPPTESTSTSIVDRTAQRTLAGEDATEAREYDSLPSLRVLGQLYDTYVVAESDRGLLLIDQHAADERVNYERLQRAFDGGTTAQALASPVELELTAREAALFDEYADELAAIGFGAERIDDRWIRVGQVPTVFDATLEPSLVRDVVVSFVESAEGGERTIGGVADELLADLACYPAVTGNTSLTEGSVVDLLEALDECANPYACPHGRPTIIEFGREDIEDRFERDYPGHADQRRRE